MSIPPHRYGCIALLCCRRVAHNSWTDPTCVIAVRSVCLQYMELAACAGNRILDEFGLYGLEDDQIRSWDWLIAYVYDAPVEDISKKEALHLIKEVGLTPLFTAEKF